MNICSLGSSLLLVLFCPPGSSPGPLTLSPTPSLLSWPGSVWILPAASDCTRPHIYNKNLFLQPYGWNNHILIFTYIQVKYSYMWIKINKSVKQKLKPGLAALGKKGVLQPLKPGPRNLIRAGEGMTQTHTENLGSGGWSIIEQSSTSCPPQPGTQELPPTHTQQRGEELASLGRRSLQGEAQPVNILGQRKLQLLSFCTSCQQLHSDSKKRPLPSPI